MKAIIVDDERLARKERRCKDSIGKEKVCHMRERRQPKEEFAPWLGRM